MTHGLKSALLATLATAVTSVATVTLSGCATTELLESGNKPVHSPAPQKTTLTNDEVVAFGKPATALANIPADSIVIVGEKNSYVLTQGGYQVSRLLTSLDPNYIQVTKPLDFYSEKNDGRFNGSLDIAYTKLKSSFTQADYDLVLRNQGRECSSEADGRMNAQRFCFSVPLQGAVYPAVSNLALIQSKFKPLSHPYQISIYTLNTAATPATSGTSNPAAKLVMLPFALAFDVITLPVQILSGMD